MRELTYNEAALEAIAEEMRRDPKIFYMSTDALPPLLREFGAQRVRATPITEAALTGMSIGAAGCGFRPIVDWRQVTFCFVAMDQIVNQAAKIHYMFGGQVTFPILYRAAVGGGGLVAAQHSQSPYSMFMNVAGLKMFLPSTPYDIKGLLKTAIRDNNPVISFESSRLMGKKGPVPEEDYTIPFGQADIKREGSDVTVVALAWLVHEALAAAEELAKEGISVEIVDPRTLVPLDRDDDPPLGAENRAPRHRRRGRADRRLLGRDRRCRHRGCRDLRAAPGPGEAGLRAAGADPLQPGPRKSRLPRPQADHRRDPRGARRTPVRGGVRLLGSIRRAHDRNLRAISPTSPSRGRPGPISVMDTGLRRYGEIMDRTNCRPAALRLRIHPGLDRLQLRDHVRIGDPGEPRHLFAVHPRRFIEHLQAGASRTSRRSGRHMPRIMAGIPA